MRCSEFREHHCAFIDDTLAGVELVRMQRHITECPACAEHDTRVRRSLMVARTIPMIELSPGFSRRLEARLRECRRDGEERSCVNFRTVAAVGAVASALMLGYISESLLRQTGSPKDIIFPPVVAMATPPSPDPAEISPAVVSQAPAIIASVSAGIPIWPAALFAEQVPIHFARYAKRH